MLKHFISSQATRRSLSLVIMLMMMVSLVACNNDPTTPASSSAASSTPESTPTSKPSDVAGNYVKYATWTAPTGLFHPDLLTADYDSVVTGLIFENLVQFSPDFEYVPALAKSWTISEDGLSVTFDLVETNWHDGVPFTAEDVKFSLEFVGHKDYTGPRYSNVEKIAGMPEWHAGEAEEVTGIEIIDEHTIKITTSEILAPFLYHIGGRPMMPKHIWGEVEVANAESARDVLLKPIGTGPFVFKEYVPDSHVIVDANPDYHKGAPKIDGVILMAVAQDTAQAQLIQGEIDYMAVSDFNPDSLQLFEDAGITVQTAGLVAVQYMGVNHRLEKFQPKEVRQAMAHAINRQGIVDNLLFGEGNVANNPFPTTIWAYPGEEDLNPYEYDSAKAIALLEGIGYSFDADAKVMSDPEGNPVKWVLKYPSGNIPREQAAAVIQDNFKDIGIELDLILLEFNAMSDQVKAEDFELFLMGMGTSFDADQKYIWQTGAEFNYAGWADELTDQLLDDGMRHLDIETRKAIYHQWAEHMNEHIPNVWLYNWNGGIAVSPKLKNVTYYAGGSFFAIENWEYVAD